MAMICVRGVECSGCGDCLEEAEYYCPECGEPLEYNDQVFRTVTGDVLGCCHCILTADAEDVL